MSCHAKFVTKVSNVEVPRLRFKYKYENPIHASHPQFYMGSFARIGKCANSPLSR